MKPLAKKFFHETAMTLTELLVASLIVGIVMLGVISIDYAVRSSKRNISETSLMVMQASAAMHQITRDAMRVMGDHSTTANRGITWDAVGAIQNICFRYDADNNPNDYTGDRWSCYSINSADSNILYRCAPRTTELAADAVCPAAPTSPEVRTQLVRLAQTNLFAVNLTGGTKIDSISINLVTRVRPADPANPLANPEYRLQSILSPPGLSR